MEGVIQMLMNILLLRDRIKYVSFQGESIQSTIIP